MGSLFVAHSCASAAVGGHAENCLTAEAVPLFMQLEIMTVLFWILDSAHNYYD